MSIKQGVNPLWIDPRRTRLIAIKILAGTIRQISDAYYELAGTGYFRDQDTLLVALYRRNKHGDD